MSVTQGPSSHCYVLRVSARAATHPLSALCRRPGAGPNPARQRAPRRKRRPRSSPSRLQWPRPRLHLHLHRCRYRQRPGPRTPCPCPTLRRAAPHSDAWEWQTWVHLSPYPASGAHGASAVSWITAMTLRGSREGRMRTGERRRHGERGSVARGAGEGVRGAGVGGRCHECKTRRKSRCRGTLWLLGWLGWGSRWRTWRRLWRRMRG